MRTVFELDHASLRFGRFTALREIDLVVEEGETLVLLGPNGAGKTCVMKLMCGLLAASSGVARASSFASLGRIGYCPQESAVWDNLRVKEQLLLVASFYGIRGTTARRRSDALLSDFSLEEESHKLARELSRGNRRKLNFVLSIFHDPPILLLDEPEAELDIESRAALSATLASLAKGTGRTIVVSTHHVSEAEGLADRVAVIHRGRLLACARLADLAKPSGELSSELPSRGRLERAYLDLIGAPQ